MEKKILFHHIHSPVFCKQGRLDVRQPKGYFIIINIFSNDFSGAIPRLLI